MNNRKKKPSDIIQSAINNLRAGESISIGDVIQNSQNIRLQGALYNHVRMITERYKEKKDNLMAEYKAERQSNRESLCDELKEFAEELERQVARSKKNLDLEQARQDVKKLNSAISRLAQISPNTDESRMIQILENELLQSLSYVTEEDVRNIKVIYEKEQEKLEENLQQELEECKTERDAALYRNELIKKLDEDGYPLKRLSRIDLERLASDFSLDESTIESITRETIEPLYEDNLQEYRQTYQQKLEQEGFPLNAESGIELDNLLESLGLSEYYFDHLGVEDCEKQLVRPFYKENLQKYKQAYQQKLGQEGFPISHDSITELKDLEVSLGLSKFFLEGLNVKSARKELIEPYYQDNLQKYEQTYKRMLDERGFPLSSSNAENLRKFKEFLCLKNSYFELLGLKDDFSPEADSKDIEKVTRRLFYHENIKKYEKVYREKFEEIASPLGGNSDADLKDLQQALGLLDEDARVVESLIQKNFEVEHLVNNYYALRELLADRDWRKADEETRNIILKTSDYVAKGKLDKHAITDFPAKDSYTIDRLWIEYSEGRFGLSVQKKIFERVNRKKQAFGEAVGWSNKAGLLRGLFAWKSYSELTFTLDAPEGHLPIWGAKDKTIFADDFLHLMIWNFGESGSELSNEVGESGSESSNTNILAQSFQKIFESINQFDIKKKVDKMGIDGFINQCAILAATTGAASGFGGFATMIVGVPFDVLNNVLQQFRVTLAVIYYKKGVYKVSFAELIKIVGVSIGVEVGATLTKSVMINVANKILVRLSASVAGKAVPFLGAAIGGSVNYGFVKAVGAAVKRIDMNAYTFQSEGSTNELDGQ
jgi:GUN4-like